MVSYLEDSCASDTDYSETDPLNYRRYNNGGGPSKSSVIVPRSNRAAAFLLILVTVLERCSYYTLTVNLPFTLSRWFRISNSTNETIAKCTGDSSLSEYSHMDTVMVVSLMIVFNLLNSLFSVLGGWLGDSKLGRYKTLVMSFVCYILGSISFLLLMWAMICNANNDKSKVEKFCQAYHVQSEEGEQAMQWVMLMLSFLLLSMGYGFCKPNIAPFGADQMRETGDAHLQRFYLWFYFFTNIGALVAHGVGFLQTQNSQAMTYFYSFTISLGLSVICLLLLLLGLRLGSKIGVFVKIEPLEDTFQTFFSILKEWILSFKTNSEVIREIGLSRLDLLRRGNGGRFGDEEVTAFADLWRVVPVMSTMVIYWTCYSQFNSFFYFQAFYLQRPQSVPLSIVNLMNPCLILLMVPLLKDVVYPYLRKRNLELHAFTRMQLGFAMAGLSLFGASVIGWEEKMRTQPEWNPISMSYFHPEDNSKYITYIVRDMSIAWLSPQIFLISISEVFAVIASMEFIYIEAPQYMKSFAMGIYFFTWTVGDTVAILLVLIVKSVTPYLGGPWICNNLNSGNIAYFFQLLIVLMIANMMCLWYHSKKFRPSFYDYRFRVQDRL